jgi:hypothetical protein
MLSDEKARSGTEKEQDALIRMLIYLRHELIRNNFIEEAEFVSSALTSLSSRAKDRDRPFS